MAKAIQAINTLQAGQLATHEAHNPSSQKYANGLIKATGVRFTGGRATHANGVGPFSSHLFRTDFVPYPDGGTYIRNTTASLADTVSALSADLPSSTSVPLDDRLKKMLVSQYHLARIGSEVDSQHLLTGRPDKFIDGMSTGNALLFSNTTDSFYVSTPIKYVRAVRYIDPATLNQRWGILGTRKVSGYIGNYQKDITGSYPVTICDGVESSSGSNSTPYTYITYTQVPQTTWQYVWNPVTLTYDYVVTTTYIEVPVTNIAYEDLSISINITPNVYTIEKGWYSPYSNVAAYLVGTMKMFSSSTAYTQSDRKTYGSRLQGFQGSVLDVDTSKSEQNQDGYDDVYVFRWATTTEDQIAYDANDPVTDANVQSLASKYILKSNNAPTQVRKFYFSTARNKVVKLRRCGVAQFVDSTSSTNTTNGERDFYVGFTKLATSPGDGNLTTIATSVTSDAEQYMVSLGAKPKWVEIGYQGVFTGTSDGEYLISNEQVAKSYSVQRISSVGSGSETTNYTDAATSLYGVIYFITKRGVAHLNFSTERNTYIPTIVDIVDMGYSKPYSICSSKTLNCILVHCYDGTILQMSPDTGAISSISVGSPSTELNSYSFVGLCTEDGEAKFVWSSSTDYVQAFLIEDIKLMSSIVTTAFANQPNSNVKFNKVILSLSNSFGGKVGVYGKDLVDIPYTADEITARSFTGIKTVIINDLISNSGEEKSIQVEFESNNDMNISYIGIEGEA